MVKIESEKLLDRKLAKRVKALGGMYIKCSAMHNRAMPDRICIFNGLCIFVELKTTGKRPTAAQKNLHKKLRALRLYTEVIDSSEKIDVLIRKLESTRLCGVGTSFYPFSIDVAPLPT